MTDLEKEIKAAAADILTHKSSDRRPPDPNLKLVLERAFKVAKLINEADLSFVSVPVLQNVRRTLDQMRHHLANYFSPNPTGLEPTLGQWVQNILNEAGALITLGLISNGNHEDYLTQGRTSLDKLTAETKSLFGELDTRNSALKDALQMAQQQIAEAATAAHATEFEQESERNRQSANLWLALTVLVGIVALSATYKLFINPSPSVLNHFSTVSTATNSLISTNAIGPVAVGSDSITFHALQSLIARVVFVSFLYFFVVWIGRNYAASRHNQIVNRHRRNAMQTFKAFTSAATDQQTKEFILRQAVACAFTPQQSGYLKDEELPDSPPLLVDAAKLGGEK